MATHSLSCGVLKQVSRSFYLTLRVLPAAIRPQISLAYLLARATDTIADTNQLPVSDRLRLLSALRRRILGQSSHPLDLTLLTEPQVHLYGAPNAVDPISHPVSPGEFLLLRRIEEIISRIGAFTREDQQRIREVLSTITSGQQRDLTRFGGAGPDHLVALSKDLDLDDYTYRVAGCVGEFWTKMCRAHLFPQIPCDEDTLVAQGVRFGKGLQLVNILRDLAADLRLGRCYLPQESLLRAGLTPKDLLEPANEPRLRPVYQEWLDRAKDHLEAGWRYTCSLPRHCRRVRLACAWPLLIGVKTLSRLQREPVLDATHRVKITRPEVRAILFRSVLLLPWPTRWAAQFNRHLLCYKPRR